jgi:hypothetical protein
MTKKAEIIETLIKALHSLPEDKVKEIYDYADFLSKKYEDSVLMAGMHSLAESNFNYLSEDEDIYTVSDLKEVF